MFVHSKLELKDYSGTDTLTSAESQGKARLDNPALNQLKSRRNAEPTS